MFKTYREAQAFFGHCYKWTKKQDGILYTLSLAPRLAHNRIEIICNGCGKPTIVSLARHGFCKDCVSNGVGRKAQSAKMSAMYRADGNPNYVDGGARQTFRQKPEGKQWAKKVKERDKACLICGGTDNLHAHHVLPSALAPEYALDVENGVTLCRFHHITLHVNRLDLVMFPALVNVVDRRTAFLNSLEAQSLRDAPYVEHDSFALIRCLPKNYGKALLAMHPSFAYKM